VESDARPRPATQESIRAQLEQPPHTHLAFGFGDVAAVSAHDVAALLACLDRESSRAPPAPTSLPAAVAEALHDAEEAMARGAREKKRQAAERADALAEVQRMTLPVGGAQTPRPLYASTAAAAAS
jgi:hypothetical protein